jgi:hypothetical protein
MKNIKATVTGISFYTSIYGKVKPVIKLKDSFRIKGANLDALALDSFEPIVTKQISDGATIYFKLGNRVTIKTVKNGGYTSAPKTCPTCGAILMEMKYDRYCVSKKCPSVARSGIYKMLSHFDVDVDDSDVMKWLNSFPLNTTVNVPLHSIFDFFHFFSSGVSGKKDTEARLRVLKNVVEDGQKIYDIEQKLSQELVKPMTTKLLVEVLNLKDITPEDADKLVKLDYINLIDNVELQEKIKESDISALAIEALMINSVAIQKLMDKYNLITA